MTKPTLIYFASRGRAEVIRLIASEAGLEWDEHPIGKGTPPRNGRPTDFAALKETGLLAFNAVPVWEEPDGFRLAQSGAIARYLGATHGLMGRNTRETALVEQMIGAYDDLRSELRKIVAGEPDRRPAIRQEIETNFLPRWLGYFDRLLDGRPYVVPGTFTIADLHLWYVLEMAIDNKLATLDAHPRLAAFMTGVAERPRIKAYISSSRRFPFSPFPT